MLFHNLWKTWKLSVINGRKRTLHITMELVCRVFTENGKENPKRKNNEGFINYRTKTQKIKISIDFKTN